MAETRQKSKEAAKTAEEFESTMASYKTKLEKNIELLEISWQSASNETLQVHESKTIINNIETQLNCVNNIFDECMNDLERINSTESQTELEAIKEYKVHVNERSRHHIDKLKVCSVDIESISSQINGTSKRIAEKRAEIEAAKIKLKYAEKERLLKLRQIELEREVEIMEQQKRIDTLNAEFEVLQLEEVPQDHDMSEMSKLTHTSVQLDSMFDVNHKLESVPSSYSHHVSQPIQVQQVQSSYSQHVFTTHTRSTSANIRTVKIYV